MQTRRVSLLSRLGAWLLSLAGLFLLFGNLTVNVSASDLDGDGPAGEVGCSIAPYDAGFNGNDEGPGGERSKDYFDEVAADCYAANSARFNAAIGAGALALLLLGAAVVTAPRSPRSNAAP